MIKRKEITVLIAARHDLSIQMERINNYRDHFSNLIVVCPELQPLSKDYPFNCVEYAPQNGIVQALNKAIELVTTPWILYLNEYERLDWDSLQRITLENGKVYAGSIDLQGAYQVRKEHYEVRLFPGNGEVTFSGYDFPCVSSICLANGWVLSDQTLSISRTVSVTKPVDPDEELEKFPKSASANLMKAINLAAIGEHKYAVLYFRKALKIEQLFPFNYTAVLNGLANSLVEMNHWDESRKSINKSLEIYARQRMPYLVLYKIAQSKRDWNQAGKFLEEYLVQSEEISRTNFDVTLPKEDFHFLRADAAFRSGNYKSAFQHYEQYYELKNGDISSDLIERLFIYSIELSDYDKSKKYFMDLFGDYIPDQLDEKTKILMNEALSLFIDKGWLDFACQIFEQIYDYNPDDSENLHRWVAALIKAKEIQKAQSLISIAKKSHMVTAVE